MRHLMESVYSRRLRAGRSLKAALLVSALAFAPAHAMAQETDPDEDADAVEEAVERGVPLGGFQEPSLAGCGPRAVERKDPWTVTAENKCDSLYLSVIGEEHTASGKMRPIVFYHLSATGGSLRTSGYTAVAPHPVTGVWTPLVFLK